MKLLTMARAAISKSSGAIGVPQLAKLFRISPAFLAALSSPGKETKKSQNSGGIAKLLGGFSLSLRPIKSLKFHGGQRNVGHGGRSPFDG
ncbi:MULTISPECIES: hypothetical protein [Arthrospira]|jgi:hypothetical protein|uniref:hypothetical protein n=1 Tax=Oscillatoriales TaxID=1150 RepID=UPI0001D0E3EE|nr:hypothetical protein [Arthrospira platensis]MBD2669803.1 hypothetical protein [Arthrospira platensis FACHB-439]MBD2710409.1 hypothetical protein [Arthrospira platensis FACHB-835]MDF2208935.1 hypothetical protein [Arthrospira platensis NCB002]MDT9182924.1 hypothetical protein [Limnospira sp. PMC 289.06]MDT9295105.1 hypothetical protein [Arthrospira platensis PCC 7345]MDT9310692.1 hypothetical protein [Limnospira sp. Paracas R14]QQW29346.1 hypothetical protein AP9108_32290 [Arthrospira sp. 